MAAHPSFRRLARRSFLGGSLGAAAGAAALPPGGAHAAGSDVIRIGLVGCGGRGTGAAQQAALAAAGVRIVALGDLFGDQVAAAAGLLAARLGEGFACPPTARFVGRRAAAEVMTAGVDAVILATPPHLRPVHAAGAVEAGLHVYCETPAGVDAAGVVAVRRAAAEAAARGLVFMSGLQSRHDAAAGETADRVVAGAIGQVRRAVATFRSGPVWRRGTAGCGDPAVAAIRNWISEDRLSGGLLVAHHVQAIDRCLRALGDVSPVAVEPLEIDRPLPQPAGGRPQLAAVRYLFADGASLEAVVERREGIETEIQEFVEGVAGVADLRRHHIVGSHAWRHAGGGPNPHAACASSFVSAIVSGRPGDDSESLCRATFAAVLGQAAIRAGRRLPWREVSSPRLATRAPAPGTTATI